MRAPGEPDLLRRKQQHQPLTLSLPFLGVQHLGAWLGAPLTAAVTSALTVGSMQCYCIVTDDINITNIDHVFWAICTQVRPEESIEIVNR